MGYLGWLVWFGLALSALVAAIAWRPDAVLTVIGVSVLILVALNVVTEEERRNYAWITPWLTTILLCVSWAALTLPLQPGDNCAPPLCATTEDSHYSEGAAMRCAAVRDSQLAWALAALIAAELVKLGMRNDDYRVDLKGSPLSRQERNDSQRQ